MYSGIKEALGPVPKKTTPLCAPDGTLLTDIQAQLDRWVEHYSSLYGTPVNANLTAIAMAIPQLPLKFELDREITAFEVK